MRHPLRTAMLVMIAAAFALSLAGCGTPAPADESATVSEEVSASVLGEDFSVDVTSSVTSKGEGLPLIGDAFAPKTREYGVVLTWTGDGEELSLGPIPPYEGDDSAADLAEDWASLDEAFRGFILEKVVEQRQEGERIAALRVRPEGLDDPDQPGQGTEFDATYVAPDGSERTETWQWRLPAGWMPPA